MISYMTDCGECSVSKRYARSLKVINHYKIPFDFIDQHQMQQSHKLSGQHSGVSYVPLIK